MFVELPEFLEHSAGHKPIVGVVWHHVDVEELHETVKHFGSVALEGRVRATVVAHAVDYFAALAVLVYHVFDDADVVLEICIQADNAVALGSACRLHAGPDGILMTCIAGKADAVDRGVASSACLDEVPSFVATAIIDIKNVAFLSNCVRRF